MAVSVIDGVLAGLAALGRLSDPLAWTVVAVFLAGALVEAYDRRSARPVAVLGWVLFGAFWLTLLHHFAIVQKSIVEGVGAAVAVPACLSVAVLLARGRDSLFVLTRSVAVMGLIFLPFEALAVLRRPLIEAVTAHTAFLIDLLGVDYTVVGGLEHDGLGIPAKSRPYNSTFVFYHEGHPLFYTVVIACTGVGSMAVIGGLIAAVGAPLDRKLRAFAASIPVIYALNLVRNVFIAVGFGTQRFHVFPELVMTAFADDTAVMVSYYVADRVIAQSMSVVALVGITWVVVHQLPELLTVVEDVLYVLTRREYDLKGALNLQTVRADGSGDASE